MGDKHPKRRSDHGGLYGSVSIVLKQGKAGDTRPPAVLVLHPVCNADYTQYDVEFILFKNRLLNFNGSTGFFQLLFDSFSFIFRNSFLDGRRYAFDQFLGFLKT